MRWFVHGDKNTKFFHSYVQGRRRKLHMHELQDDDGNILNTQAEIGKAAVSFFRNQFTKQLVYVRAYS